MPAPDWRIERSQTQLEYLPLITVSIATIQMLMGMRDFIVYRGLLPGFLLQFIVLSIVVAWFIAILSKARRIPLAYSHAALFISMYLLALRPVATLIAGPLTQELYFTVTIVGSALSSLFVLSRRQFFLFNSCSIATWSAAALYYLSPAQALLLPVACAVASGFGYMLLNRRINTLTLIYALQNRVENLEAILPMCSGCKKTRDEEGNWMPVESYIEGQAKGLQVSHALCGDCKESLYGDYLRKFNNKIKPA